MPDNNHLTFSNTTTIKSRIEDQEPKLRYIHRAVRNGNWRTIAPLDFGRNRSKTFSFKRPFPLSNIFSDNPTALIQRTYLKLNALRPRTDRLQSRQANIKVPRSILRPKTSEIGTSVFTYNSWPEIQSNEIFYLLLFQPITKQLKFQLVFYWLKYQQKVRHFIGLRSMWLIA